MSKKFLNRLVQSRFKSPQEIRKLLDAAPANKPRQYAPHQNKYMEGVHNGQFVRIKVPPAERPRLGIPKLPPPQNAPKAFKKSVVLPNSNRQQPASSLERLQAWWIENWPVLVLNFGSVCTLMGFTRSDVLELRALSATGSITFCLYGMTQIPLRYTPVVWSATFAAVNAFKIFEIFQERQGTVHLTAVQEQVYIQFFMPHGVTPKQFEAIHAKAVTVQIAAGQRLISQGEKLSNVYLITEGSTRANILGRHLTAASTTPKAHQDQMGGASGAWVGEMTFLESYWLKEQGKHVHEHEQQQQPQDATTLGGINKKTPTKKVTTAKDATAATAVAAAEPQVVAAAAATKKSVPQQPKLMATRAMYTIVAEKDCTVLRWSFDDMEGLLERSTDIRSAMTRAMSAAIVGKVINFTVSRSTGRPTWSAWLDDWKYSAGAQIQVEDEDQQKQQQHFDLPEEDDSAGTASGTGPQLEKLPVYPIILKPR